MAVEKGEPKEMTEPIALVFAHPDDETFLSAALIRRLADEGNAPVLLLATKGDAGKKNGAFAHLSNEELAELREAEMSRAAEILGLSAVEHLAYPDGKLQEADEAEFVRRVAGFLNRHRSPVVVTFPEDGGNYHPDHMAISRIATKAVLDGWCPHVEKLYYILSAPLAEKGVQPAFRLDTEPYWPVKAAALRAHDSQALAIERYFGPLDAFPEQRRYEAFVLAWERGEAWPKRTETWIMDRLNS